MWTRHQGWCRSVWYLRGVSTCQPRSQNLAESDGETRQSAGAHRLDDFTRRGVEGAQHVGTGKANQPVQTPLEGTLLAPWWSCQNEMGGLGRQQISTASLYSRECWGGKNLCNMAQKNSRASATIVQPLCNNGANLNTLRFGQDDIAQKTFFVLHYYVYRQISYMCQLR